MIDELTKVKQQLKEAESHCVLYENEIRVLKEDIKIFRGQSEHLTKENEEYRRTVQELRNAIKYISKLL